MKLLLVVIISLLFNVPGLTQISVEPSVVASGGGYAETDALSISWTLGEIATSTLSGNGMLLTQGFHQPGDIGVGINDIYADWKISAYPNPVQNTLFVKFDIPDNCAYWIEILDLTGRVMSLKEYPTIFPDDVITINTSNYISGVYTLKVFSPKGHSRIFSIRKL